MYLLLLLAVLLLLLANSAGAESKARRRRDPLDKPNFVLLFMDDLGYGDVGFTGHPTTSTPHIDKLAFHGKILTTWYSGCAVCSGSRAALLTGRQFPRAGVPGVFGPAANAGLPLNETTVAEQLRRRAGYASAAVGKWHLGQRMPYLPMNRGFDAYLGIPYSDDMGSGYTSSCRGEGEDDTSESTDEKDAQQFDCRSYAEARYLHPDDCSKCEDDPDPAGKHLPLVQQKDGQTTILEQPLDFTTLAEKYERFATEFIEENADRPFFLYVPFSHVHVTANDQPEKQYAGCEWKGSTKRGAFGDALAEADNIVGAIHRKLQELELEENTLILFASDNGPWLPMGLSGGSAGLFTGRYAGYWDTGKGSTWEGGIRSPSFAHWKGTINPYSRSSEVVSSLDVMPTLSSLAGVALPPDRVMDGRDMSDILLRDGQSHHDFLFLYGFCHLGDGGYGISAVRHGKYKAHFCTSPGFVNHRNNTEKYEQYPLLFDVEQDPSESLPISTGGMPSDPEDQAAMGRIMNAYAMEVATFTYGRLTPEPDGPGEGPGQYGLCCDRTRDCDCSGDQGLFNVGTKQHHDKFHDALGKDEPNPPATLAQANLRKE